MAQRPDAAKQDRWRELIHRWQCSQTTVREFCQRHRVSEASFFSWRRVLRERGLMDDAPAQAQTPAFVKLTAAPEAATFETAASAVEVLLGRRVVRVRPGFDADMLLELVRLLEEPAC